MVDQTENKGLDRLFDCLGENPSASKALLRKEPFNLDEALRKTAVEVAHHIEQCGDPEGILKEGMAELKQLTLIPNDPSEEPIEWYRPCAADLARQVVQKDRHGQNQNYGNLVVVTVGGIKCLTDELYALSLGWDYEIVVSVPIFSKEYALCFCPDMKMKWADHYGTPVFQPAPDGDIFIAVEVFIFLMDEKDMFAVVQALKADNPHYRSSWVGARRLI